MPQLTPRELIVAVCVAFLVIGTAAASRIWSGGDGTLSPAAEKARAEAFRGAGQLTLSAVKPIERPEAQASMQLSMQPADVRRIADGGYQTLVWLSLCDDMSEDGDTVEIVSDGYARIVRLTNAPIRIALPFPERGVIDVRGIHDGGGGITAAIVMPTGKIPLPLLIVGQVIGVPVKIEP